MIQNYSRYRILQEFFDCPRKDFQMREISRRTKISQPSVINHLKALVKEGLILKEKKGIYPSFRANRESEIFRGYKRADLLLKIKQSGLLDAVYDACVPNAIVLFGSSSKGEDIEESDVDLFVWAKGKKLSLGKYEKSLKRGISLFFEDNFSRLSEELRNNIINGIVLKGYLKVF